MLVLGSEPSGVEVLVGEGAVEALGLAVGLGSISPSRRWRMRRSTKTSANASEQKFGPLSVESHPRVCPWTRTTPGFCARTPPASWRYRRRGPRRPMRPRQRIHQANLTPVEPAVPPLRGRPPRHAHLAGHTGQRHLRPDPPDHQQTPSGRKRALTCDIELPVFVDVVTTTTLAQETHSIALLPTSISRTTSGWAPRLMLSVSGHDSHVSLGTKEFKTSSSLRASLLARK